MSKRLSLEDSVYEDEISRIMDETEEELLEEEIRELNQTYFAREREYLSQLLSIPPLSRAEQIRYIRLIRKTGDQKKREILINSNLRLVAKIAFNFRRRFSKKIQNNLEIPELISVGVEGLIRALDWFDPDRGNAFSTYVTYCARNEMRHFMAQQRRALQIPCYYVLKKVIKVRNFVDDFFKREGREPTFEEIASKTQVSLREAMEAYEFSSMPVSYNPTKDGFVVEKNPYSDPRRKEYLRELEETKQELMDILGVLNTREREVLCKRFGVGQATSMTLQEVGKFYHVTGERIRQIQRRAIEKLREENVMIKLSGLLRDFSRIRGRLYG